MISHKRAMKDLTEKQAKAEALKRWGPTGTIHLRPESASRDTRGRLARYRCTVGNGYLGKGCSVRGQGDTWKEAFEDAERAAAQAYVP